MAGDINERQNKINVNEYEYDDIVIVVSLKLILTKNNLSWAPDCTVSVLVTDT